MAQSPPKPRFWNPTLAAIAGLAAWFVSFLVQGAWEATRIKIGDGSLSEFAGLAVGSAVGASVARALCDERAARVLLAYLLVPAPFLFLMGAVVASMGDPRLWWMFPVAHIVSGAVAFAVVGVLPGRLAKWSFPVLLVIGGYAAGAMSG